MSSTPAPNVPTEHAWTRSATIGLLVLVAAMLAALPFLVSSNYEASDETNDASIYIATARSLLAGEGYSYLGEPFIVRPPGFALLIAGVWKVCGESFLALNVMVSLFGVAACALLYALCVPRLGVWLSLIVAGGLFVDASFRAMSNQVMSDVPGLALVLGGLLLERWASRRPSLKRDLVLGVFIGLAAYVRTIELVLVPAIVASRALGRGVELRPLGRFLRTRVLVLAGVVVALVAPWSVRCALHHPVPPVDQTFLYSYSTGMWHERPYDPQSPRLGVSAVLGRIPTRARQIVDAPEWAFAPLVQGDPLTPDPEPLHAGKSLELALVGAQFALLLTATAWTFVRRREARELFVLFALALLSVYFAFRPRLLLPLSVLVWPAVLDSLLALAARVTWSALARNACVAVAALVALAHALRPTTSAEIARQHSLRTESAQLVGAELGPGRVAAPIGWHWSVYLNRPVWSLALTARRGGAAGLEATLARHAIDTVILTRFLPEDQALMQYFDKNWGTPTEFGTPSLIDVYHRPR